MSANRIDRVLALMSYLRICAEYGRERLMKGIVDIRNSAPFAELDELQRATVLGYGAGRMDAIDCASGAVSVKSLAVANGVAPND